MINFLKKFYKSWGFVRIFRLGLGIALGFAYLESKENIYLMGFIVLTAQAIFNISCPGGACTTNNTKSDQKQVMTFEKLESKK